MKMKTLIPLIALAVLMILPGVASARKVHDFACEFCHKANMVLDNVAQIVCLDCHTTGHEADQFALKDTGPGLTNPVGNGVFVKGDASDALGSSTAQGVVAGDQTSHNWGASDVNPAAGASAPSDPAFYGKNYSGPTVSCGRCHDPHGKNTALSYYDPYAGGFVSEPANPKLLKLGAGSTDAMCVDCHAAWNVTNANAYLTHPLVANYATFQASNSAKYKPFTPNGDMALDANGNITCSTCHGVHFTDSSAATTDGKGQPLVAGDGYMLKGNGRTTGDTSSICQSCHVYKQHGAGQVGCIDCHSGHAYNNGTPNYFVLRDNVSLASYPVGAPTSPGTNMAYTSVTYPWKNAGSGYCENCHTLTTNHNGLTAGGQADCNGCHNHSDPASTFTAGVCNQCHGFPPQDDTKGAGTVGTTTTGFAFDPVTGFDYSLDPNKKSEVAAKHSLHAGTGAAQYKFSCSECHNGNTHKAGTFQDVFKTPTSFVSASSALAPGYVVSSGTCSAVYCHSNGGPRGATPTAATVPAWVSGTVTCASCHGNDATTMVTAGNSTTHQKHLAKGYDCSLCHNSTATNSTTLATGAIQGTHVNGTADVAFDAASTKAQLNGTSGAYDSAAGTCSNIYCHSTGPNATAGTTPDWDLAATGQCGSCHQVNATGDTGTPLPDAHNKHVFDTDGPLLACTTCHTNNGTGVDHVDEFISTITNYQTVVCNSCHGIDGSETAPAWKVSTSASCTTCHSGTLLSTINTIQAPDKSQALATGHNKTAGTYAVSGYSAAAKACTDCHDKTATHLIGTGNKRLKPAFSCNTCHGASGTATVKNINTHQTQLCLTCHDPHGSSNIYMVRASSTSFNGTVVFTSRTAADSFDEADTNNADDICATCHTSANQTRAHNNKENVGNHAAGNKQGADCMTCHKPHTDPVNAFAVGAGTSCDGCHGFPPTKATGSLTDVHIAHSITSGNTILTSDRSDCAVCHTGADSYTYDPTADQTNGLNHSNATNRPGLITTAVGFDATNKNCTKACHTSTLGNGGTWTATPSLACDACHYYSLTPTSVGNTAAPILTLPDSSTNSQALTGTHNKHFDAGKTCADCHAVPTDLTHNVVALTGTDVQKIQGLAVATQDEADILGTVGTDVDPGNPTCNNAACHNPSNDAHSSTWNDVTAVTCDTCHSSTNPVTNNHDAHLRAATPTKFGLTLACTDCHADNGVNMAHLNGTVDVTGTKVTGYTAPNCTNSCHQDGRTGPAATAVTWGMAAQVDCTICHASQPATGSHALHLSAVKNPAVGPTTISCDSCHDNTDIVNSVAATQHLDLNLDVFDTTPSDLGYPTDRVLATVPFANCTTANCHTDGTSTTAVPTPLWGDTTAANCTACHTTMTSNGPATGSHNKHMTTTMTVVACTACHAASTNPVANTQPAAGHRDRNIDNNIALKYGTGTFTDKVIGSAASTCAAASCHDNGLGVAVTTPTWGTTPAACTACHAAAPGTASHTNHLNAIKNPVVSSTTKIGCGDCHAGAAQGTTLPTTGHLDGNLDVVNGYPLNVAKGNGTWTKCSAASCHNNGQSGLDADLGNVAGVTVTTPVWGDNAAKCSACHAASPISAKHDEHLGLYSANCGDCHDGAVAGSTGGTNHRDGLISVRTQLAYTKAGAPGNGWGTCTNPAGLTGACHGTAAARPWDASGPSCSGCHGASGSGTGEPLILTDMISTNPLGQHNVHVNTNAISCNICHNGHGMPTTDDKITMAFTGLATGGTYNPPGTWAAGKWLYTQTSTTTTQDCSNIYCHSNGQADGGGAGALTYATPGWGNIATGQCGTCHAGDGVQGNATTIASGSHTAHVVKPLSACTDCHSGNTHVNQQVEVTSVTYTSAGPLGNGYGTCSTAICHDDGTGMLKAPTPQWGTPVTNCTECHNGTNMATGSHTVHLAAPVSAACTDCHASGTNPATETAPSAGHRDGNIDVLNSLGYPQNKIKGSAYVSCATASCHVTNRNTTGQTQQWGTSVTNCTECHTTPPTGDTHNEHLNAKTNNLFGQTIGCTDCHDTATNVSTQTPPASGHRDGNIDAAGGYPAKLITDATYKTCNAASCHQTGQAVPSYKLTVNFNDTTPANCSQCHDATPVTGSHTAHVVSANKDCSACHTGAIKDTSYSLIAHGDGNVDVAVGGYTANKIYGTTKETCSAVSCHSDGLGNLSITPTWGQAGAGCSACHNDDLTAGTRLVTGSHTKHLQSLIMTGAQQIVCANCHTSANPSTSTPSATHTNGTVEAIGYATANAAIGTASWTTCSSVACHDNGTGATVTTPQWGVAGQAACTACHVTTAPATNAHGTHLALTGVSCATCHPGTTQGSVPSTGHLNGIIDITASFGYTAGAEDKAGIYGSCATTTCHNDGLGNSVASPVWNIAGTTCNSCHNTTPVTGSHTKHINSGASCGNCHSDAVVNTTPATGVHVNANVDVFDITSGDLGYPTTAALGSASWSTCNNASCHTNGTGATAKVTTPTWGNTTVPACTACHAAAPATGAHAKHLSAATNGLIASLACVNCHNDAVQGVKSPTGDHRDGNLDVYKATAGDLGYTVNVASTSPSYTTETCNTSYCHGNAMPKGTVSGTTNAPKWGDASTGCTFCHGMPPDPTTIGAHVGQTPLTCVNCHGAGKGDVNTTGTGFTNGGATHIDGVLDGGGDNCFDCHANVGSGLSGAHAAHNNIAYVGKLSTNDYGNTSNGWYAATYYNESITNIRKLSLGCGYCHPQSNATHSNGAVNVNLSNADGGATGTLKAKNGVGAAYAGSGGACSQVYCHSDGEIADISTSVSPAWVGGTVGTNCDACHKNSPVTNAHSVHSVGIHYKDLYDSSRVGKMNTAAASLAAHGNVATSTTITCVICHGSTVDLKNPGVDLNGNGNDQNLNCATACHATNPKGNVAIGTTSSTHINGTVDVSFNLGGFNTTAQLRDGITSVADVNSSWTRVNGYKDGVTGTSHDTGKVLTPVFNPGTRSCSAIICHNGNSAAWTDSTAGNCQKCHTDLPQ